MSVCSLNAPSASFSGEKIDKLTYGTNYMTVTVLLVVDTNGIYFNYVGFLSSLKSHMALVQCAVSF